MTKALLLATVTLAAFTASAKAQYSKEAILLAQWTFYRDVCPYGLDKVPQDLSREINERWAYIPDGTKRTAQKDLDITIEEEGVGKLCERLDDWVDKNFPGGNPYYANQPTPEFGIKMVKGERKTDNEYTIYTVVYNKTEQYHASTEWTCRLTNKGKIVYETKVKVDDVKARNRTITKHQILYNGNATRADCE